MRGRVDRGPCCPAPPDGWRLPPIALRRAAASSHGAAWLQGPEKCDPAEHRTPEQAALFLDDLEEDGDKKSEL
jgi:hypothetical protein